MAANAAAPAPVVAPVRFRWRILLLAALFVGLLLPRIRSGTLWHHDELLTANRAREMLVRRDPLTITVNFSPDFLKPPLQYWVSAVALALLPDQPELALRLPALLGGAACLLALGWLARSCDPRGDPWVGLCAALALAGCGFFIHFSRLALLDTGAALGLTLALAGCQRARREARWWWFVALVAVLGAWQKAPFALAAWLVVLLVRRSSGDRPAGGGKHLAGALVVAIVGCAGWWLLQAALHGWDAVLGAGRTQVRTLARGHDPGDYGFHPFLYGFWMAREWALVGLCAPVIVFCELGWRTPVSPDSTEEPAPTVGNPTLELAWVCALYGVALIFTPYRSERYLVVVAPLLALLTARWGFRRFATRRWVLVLVLLTTLPGAALHYFRLDHANRDLRAAAFDFGTALRPDETPVVCAEADPAFAVRSFVLFYADLRRPLLELDGARLNALPAPVRGICHRRQWAALQKASPATRQTSAHGAWIVWERRS